MLRPCEICSGLIQSGLARPAPDRPMRRVLLGERLVALCERHAEAARESGVETLEELRELFAEPGGRRSLVDRRAVLDRRVFPPRPEGRRRGHGRRATDPID